jgi:phosphoribosylaminoimidazole (AIR) synthetase
MMRTFNLGYGFLVITKEEDYQQYIDLYPEDIKLLGRIISTQIEES